MTQGVTDEEEAERDNGGTEAALHTARTENNVAQSTGRQRASPGPDRCGQRI